MINKFMLLIALLGLHLNSSWAMPILNANGSKLSGVQVGDALYDVMFGDGLASDVFANISFDAAREIEANAVSAAIVEALNMIGGVSYKDISGCYRDDSNDDEECFLYNPDTAVSSGFRDHSFIEINDSLWELDPIGIGSFGGELNSSFYDNVTFVTYTRLATSVPEPQSLLLFSLALLGLRLRTRWLKR